MELIPVFSLIVLVATIGTFILAVAAYVMFRFKERRGRQSSPHFPAAFEAEVITPELIGAPQPITAAPGTVRREYSADQEATRYGPDNHHPNQRIAPEEKRRWG
ncbi:MAG TPA: hypothetical protein VLT13_00230 [Bacteroidota bacterium]|nr:hypothetical protein [Bacteroidota bacterium]